MKATPLPLGPLLAIELVLLASHYLALSRARERAKAVAPLV